MADLEQMGEREIMDLILAAQAELARRAPAPLELRRIILRSKDLNSKGSGSQTTRRIRLPGGASGWASDLAQDVEGSWSSGNYLASERKCVQKGMVPVGTLVVEFTSTIRGGAKSGSADIRAGVVVTTEEGKLLHAERTGKTGGTSSIQWGLSTRKRGGEVEVQAPNGEWVTV